MSAKECEGLYVRCCECGVMINESEWEAHAIAPCAEGARGVRAASALVAHTPGPWVLDTTWGIVRDERGTAEVCAIHAGRTGKPAEAQANARLIAAAPEMFELLEWAVKRVVLENEERGNPILLAWLPLARAIIAEAKGGAS